MAPVQVVDLPTSKKSNTSKDGHDEIAIACLQKSPTVWLRNTIGLENAADQSFKGQVKVPGLRRMPRFKITHKGESAYENVSVVPDW